MQKCLVQCISYQSWIRRMRVYKWGKTCIWNTSLKTIYISKILFNVKTCIYALLHEKSHQEKSILDKRHAIEINQKKWRHQYSSAFPLTPLILFRIILTGMNDRTNISLKANEHYPSCSKKNSLAHKKLRRIEFSQSKINRDKFSLRRLENKTIAIHSTS